tara:strand:- start:51 stop:392 length:342 start_codon:yes stop_codon:yes gene_type:complete
LTFQLSSFKGFFFPPSSFVALGVVGVALGDRGDDDDDVDVDLAPLFPLMKKTKTPLLLFRPAPPQMVVVALVRFAAFAPIIITIIIIIPSTSENHKAFCAFARDTYKYLDLFF